MNTINRKLSIIFKMIIICTCFFGQILNFITGDIGLGTFLYFTNLSNIFCLVYFTIELLFILFKLNYPKFARFKGTVVMSITVTMLVFWLILNNSTFAMGDSTNTYPSGFLQELSNYIVHLIVPLLVIFDWLLFDKKGKYKIKDPIIWEAIPLIYYVFTIVIAQTGYRFYGGGRYPYFFINPDVVGVFGVIKYVLVLIIVFLVLGYIVVFIDYLLGKIKIK
ncbi:MAG: Pr6Pr family membrane protein [Bacilli bacterium]